MEPRAASGKQRVEHFRPHLLQLLRRLHQGGTVEVTHGPLQILERASVFAECNLQFSETIRLSRRLASGVLEKLPRSLHDADKRVQKLCALLNMTLRVGTLDLCELQLAELDFNLRLPDGVRFALNLLEQLFLSVAPYGARAGE